MREQRDPHVFKLLKTLGDRHLLYVVRKFEEHMDAAYENTILTGRVINDRIFRKELEKLKD